MGVGGLLQALAAAPRIRREAPVLGLAHVPASTATTLSPLEPAVAAVLAVRIVGERLPLLAWSGIVLVVVCRAALTAPTRGRGPRRAHPARARRLRGAGRATGHGTPAGLTPGLRSGPAPEAERARAGGGTVAACVAVTHPPAAPRTWPGSST
ncbi:DMT family transporter [Streptomyces sp. AD55]|uniref:DMT family transporter n=1 Tax=Streptomyces sp. AD55 TaxID=3242895 RepID=UPI003528FAF1